jgi:hypothetical protein
LLTQGVNEKKSRPINSSLNELLARTFWTAAAFVAAAGRDVPRSVFALALSFLLACGWCFGATFQEDFSVDPASHGWRVFGDTNLFNWDSTNQNLQVTWDSSSSNSYFHLATGTILTRQDEFSFAVDLRVDDIAGGVYSGKPGPFEIAFGFQNWVDAQKTNFFRGNGHNSPDLAEFDYFAGASGIQPTVWPAFWSTNSALSYNGPSDYTVMTLPLGVFMHISVAYASSNQTWTTTITTNGVSVGAVHSAKISSNFTDFRVGTFAIESYSDAGQSGSGQGSILAHGVIDNISFTVPPAPIQSLQALVTNGVAQVEFVSRSNWVYTLERTIDLESWVDASVGMAGNGTNMVIQDTNTPGANACYRVRAERP